MKYAEQRKEASKRKKGKLKRKIKKMIKIRILNENIVTEQEKITLSQIVGENSVISFDFDNTLVKSYPDFDEDGELIYINGGSNATMINLMKHLIDDPSKKVYLVTSRNGQADENAGDGQLKYSLTSSVLTQMVYFLLILNQK